MISTVFFIILTCMFRDESPTYLELPREFENFLSL
jgi:hypothetical protein